VEPFPFAKIPFLAQAQLAFKKFLSVSCFPLAIARRVRYHSKAINGSGSMMRGARAESMVACDDLFIGEAFPAQARNFALITAMNRVYTPREIQFAL
jgi:hypothetical protein